MQLIEIIFILVGETDGAKHWGIGKIPWDGLSDI